MNANDAIRVKREVRSASNRWIENFNSGNLAEIVAAYDDGATMRATPVGTFTGREEIHGAWKSLLEQGLAELEYRDVNITVLGDDEAVLSANWRMNAASGTISKELWRRQEDGVWRLEEDDFEVAEQPSGSLADNSNGSTGLLIIDLQNDYFAGGAHELCGTATAAANASRLLSKFRELELPRFHVRHVFASKAAPFFVPGSEGAAIHLSVEPIEGEPVITKNHVNSFRNTDLQEELQNAGVKRLVICGAMSHMCIDAGVRAAADFGYECLVVEDACATRDLSFADRTVDAADVQAAMMSALAFGYANVISTDDAIARVTGSAEVAT